MKTLRLFLFTVVTFNLLACSQTNDAQIGGEDVTEDFLSEYNGTFVESNSAFSADGERVIISRNGEISVLQYRDVGEENNPVIPKPTHCSFWLHGEVAHVAQLSDDYRLRTNDEGDTYFIPQTHNLVFSVYEVELTDELEAGSTTSSGCNAFKDSLSDYLPVYTYGMELFGRGTIRFHTQGWEEFDGGERTEATLDEVFVRQ